MRVKNDKKRGLIIVKDQNDGFAQKIEALCKKYNEGSQPGMCVGVIKNGHVLYKKGFGMANLEYDIPIDEFTVFHCCSMAKQFTATCVALLEEQGLLDQEQLVKDILPLQGPMWNEIKVKHLIYMTNGIFDAYDTANIICGIREDDYFTKDECWEFIQASNWLMFEPGEQWSYGNTGYFLLGEIVSSISGVSLSEFAHEHIFKPLGMTHSFLRDDRTKIIRNRAVGYSNFERLHYQEAQPFSTKGDKLSINSEKMEINGAGQLWTCLHDFILWENNFHNNKLGSKSPEFITKLVTSGKDRSGKEIGYAYGQFVFTKGGYVHVAHGGWAGGFSSFIDRVLDEQVSIIVLSNHTDLFMELEVHNKSNSLIDKIREEILVSKEVDSPISLLQKENVNFDPSSLGKIMNQAELSEYVGIYENDSLKTAYCVSVKGDNLYIQNLNRHRNALDLHFEPESRDRFKTRNSYISDYCLLFHRDEHGQVNQFSFSNGSKNMQEEFVFSRKHSHL